MRYVPKHIATVTDPAGRAAMFRDCLTEIPVRVSLIASLMGVTTPQMTAWRLMKEPIPDEVLGWVWRLAEAFAARPTLRRKLPNPTTTKPRHETKAETETHARREAHKAHLTNILRES